VRECPERHLAGAVGGGGAGDGPPEAGRHGQALVGQAGLAHPGWTVDDEPVGAGIGVAIENIAVGVGIGVALGTAIGVVLSKRNP